MQILDLQGTQYERGLQQGRQLRTRFEPMLQSLLESKTWRENRPALLTEGAFRFLLRGVGRAITQRVTTPLLPAQAERVRGLADGFGISRGFAWGVQFLEIVFCEAGNSLIPPVPSACTQLVVQPGASAGGAPYLARNYDFPNFLAPWQIIRRETPSEKGRLASLLVGQIPLAGGHQGINEAGLAVAANNARLKRGPDLRLDGVPYEMILAEILETCRTVDEAIRFATQFPRRGNAGFLAFVDERGDAAVLELTASRARVRRPGDDGTMAQTNHFLAMTEVNMPAGTTWDVDGMRGVEFMFTSGSRHRVAQERLSASAGGITVETLQDILRDHSANDGVGADHTVCVHGAQGSTLASIILDVRARIAWVAQGRPCESEFVEVPLELKDAQRQKAA